MARRPIFLVATGAVAAVAAGAVVVSTGVLSGTSGEGGSAVAVASPSVSQSVSGGAGASPAATRINARSFLLAAADTALRTTPESGDYWYTRTRNAQRTWAMPKEFWTEAAKLQRQEAAEVAKIDPNSDELVKINEKYNKKLEQLNKRFYPDGPPYEAYLVDTEERWRPKRPGNTDRVKVDNRRVHFATPQDEAKWKELGSLDLLGKQKKTQDTNLPRPLSIENMDITMQNVGQLPTTKKALGARLRANFAKLPDKDKEFDLYLWQTTVDLMNAPTTPGTRAALFQVLAEQRDIVSTGTVTDALGREGVGLAVKSDDGYEFGLIIAEDTAQLLESTVSDKNGPSLRTTYEEAGWTDKLGKRPRS